VIFGGSGTDLLSGNAGQDFLVGDAGMITRDEFLVTLESIAIDKNSSAFISDDMSFFTGADDELDGGLDNDYMIGGFGDDLFTGDLSEDIMTGEYGRYRLTIDVDQLITGLETSVTLAQGSLDLIRVVQQELYTAAPITTGSLPTSNVDSVLTNSGLAMPTAALAQNTAWAGLDALVFGDQSTATSSTQATVLPQTEDSVSDDQADCDAIAAGSGENINSEACAPALDIEQLCADLKADADNASESSEACEAPLSEDVNAHLSDAKSDTTVAADAGLAALAGWAALRGKPQSSEQRLDRSEYALVAAKAQSKRFMSWARFRD
jgi:Ca2+-binding RTX toxin-like protein